MGKRGIWRKKGSVFPEVSAKATSVIVIHENRCLNDWTRAMADQIAGEGFIVIAPDRGRLLLGW